MVGGQAREETGRSKDRFKLSELFADERSRRSWTPWQKRKSDGQRAHRWRTRNQAARPRSGKRENARNTLHRWRRGRKIRGQGDYRFSFLPLFLLISYAEHRKAEEGRRGHIVTGTRSGGQRFL